MLLAMNNLLNIAELEVSYKPNVSTAYHVKCSNDAYQLFTQLFDEARISMQESFWVLFLNRANNPIGCYKLSTGGIAGTMVDIKLLLSITLKSLASSIVIAHNHPSCNRKPSKADIELTNKIKEACALCEVNLIDHLIVTPNNAYFSFADEGMLH
jgi:DNA repair protein RadC